MKFNINGEVKVTLSDFGKKILVRHYAKYNQRPPDDEWNEGRFQLWCLMEIFGSHMNLGQQEVPFKDNVIEIEDKNG